MRYNSYKTVYENGKCIIIKKNGKRIKDEELLDYLRHFYKENRRVPKSTEINSSEYTLNMYLKVFGYWNNAIKMAGLWNKRYNEMGTCYKCIEDGKTNDDCKLVFGNVCREKTTGKWICSNHWRRDYNRYDPNSYNNILKSMRDRRTGNIDPNSTNAKGDLFQELTCRWRSTVSTIIVEDLNKKLDNYRTPIDHTLDSELGIIQTKGSLFGRLYGAYGGWPFNSEKIEKEYDYLICYCADKYAKIIERIYIIPKKEIDIRQNGFTIIKCPNSSTWYEKYRIKDEKIMEEVNEIWKASRIGDLK